MHRYLRENAATCCDELSRVWTMIQNWAYSSKRVCEPGVAEPHRFGGLGRLDL